MMFFKSFISKWSSNKIWSLERNSRIIAKSFFNSTLTLILSILLFLLSPLSRCSASSSGYCALKRLNAYSFAWSIIAPCSTVLATRSIMISSFFVYVFLVLWFSFGSPDLFPTLCPAIGFSVTTDEQRTRSVTFLILGGIYLCPVTKDNDQGAVAPSFRFLFMLFHGPYVHDSLPYRATWVFVHVFAFWGIAPSTAMRFKHITIVVIVDIITTMRVYWGGVETLPALALKSWNMVTLRANGRL